MTKTALSLRDLKIGYDGKTVIDGFSYEFESGGKYVLKGVSGSGKTTLLRCIMGLIKPLEGTMQFDGTPVFSAVFQEDRLIESISAVKNIKITSPQLAEDKIRKELRQLLDEGSLDCPVKELSGGMRRRVCIVRAIMSGSDIVIMDEPLTGLDQTNQKNVVKYIDERLSGRLFIAASHSDMFDDLCGIITIGGQTAAPEEKKIPEDL